jgi:hypothetical protein
MARRLNGPVVRVPAPGIFRGVKAQIHRGGRMIRSHADGDHPSPTEPAGLLQHASHLDLLVRDVSVSAGPEVDAIVVPAARDAAHLHAVSALAAEVGCPLVILASRRTRVEEARAVGAEHGVRPLVVDVRGRSLPVDLETHAGPYARSSDLALKRNLALLLSRLAGWECVLFLDDDVTDVDPAELRTAAALIGKYRAVGLENVGWFDNSVVCHANRDTGGKQFCFVGAGGLLVQTAHTRSFFPNVYNEDWFFLLEEDGLTEVAMSGHCVQASFDPYEEPSRARREEFGDCLAEGLFALLDDGAQLSDADHRYWRRFLDQRRRLIEEIVARSRHRPSDPVRRQRILASMNVARDALADVSASLCVAYLDAWRRDRDRWAGYVSGLDGHLGPEEALARLGLAA